jgi:cellulose synthase/poly-beta-1,6-N-acetylglucosamine synthase-like glycosyltransferase
MGLAGVAAFLTVLCLGLQLYHYVIYPLILGVLARLSVRRTYADAPMALRTTMVICAHNEAGVIAEKIANTLALEPAPDEVIVVNDGSTDATLALAIGAAVGAPRVQVLDKPERGGKSAAMNYGAASATGEVLIFSDASEMYERQALLHLLAEFSDASVGAVSGSHRLRPARTERDLIGKSEGLYWRYEDFIRRSESAIGATVASVGSMLAIRAQDWRPLPPGTINDDAWITMSTLARGRNVRFASRAISWEEASESSAEEQTRRRRITAGRILLLGRPEIWPLRRPAVLLAFLSHKVLRIALPFLMIGGIAANMAVVLLRPDWWGFGLTLALQLLGFALAAAGYLADRTGRRWRLAHLFYHITRSNLSILLAVRDIAAGRSFLKWDKPSR